MRKFREQLGLARDQLYNRPSGLASGDCVLCVASRLLFTGHRVALAVSVWASIAVLSACGGDVSRAYKPATGPFEVEVVNPVTLEFPALKKQLLLRIAYPAARGRYPLIIFSHGGRLSKDDYTDITDHWVSHGYIVIQPTHMDSASLGFSIAAAGRSGMLEAARTRRLDVKHVLDSLDELQRLVPPLAQRLDRERIVSAGHSMGGATALTVAGLEMVDPRSGAREGFADPRFDALLLISEPGNNPIMPADPWRAVGLPTFVATGSEDYSSRTGQRPSSDKRLYSFPPGFSPPSTPNHYLFINGMDHYLGGVLNSQEIKPDGDPDLDALQIVNGASTAFLDAYLKDDGVAMQFLAGADMNSLTGGRAELDIR